MSESQPPPTQPHFANAQMSAICPGDLGLKAGFWSGKDGDPVTFRPILGWVVITNYLDTAQKVGPLIPVVLNDFSCPVLWILIPGNLGVFEKDVTPEQALEKSAAWRSKPGDGTELPIAAQQGQPN